MSAVRPATARELFDYGYKHGWLVPEEIGGPRVGDLFFQLGRTIGYRGTAEALFAEHSQMIIGVATTNSVSPSKFIHCVYLLDGQSVNFFDSTASILLRRTHE